MALIERERGRGNGNGGGVNGGGERGRGKRISFWAEGVKGFALQVCLQICFMIHE